MADDQQQPAGPPNPGPALFPQPAYGDPNLPPAYDPASAPPEFVAPAPPPQQEEKPKTRFEKFLAFYRRASGGSLLLSVGLHALIFLIGFIWVVHSFVEDRKVSFGGGDPGPKSDVQHKVQMKRKTNQTAPAPTKRITTTSNLANVALPDMPDMPTNMGPSIAGAMGAGGFGAAGGLGGGGGGGGGGRGGGIGAGFSNFKFFGLRSGGRRIAFLVDYSQSMTGPFRKSMEKKLESSLKELPAGTQILIIPWAGGAWLATQRAPQIKDMWKRGKDYDDFKLLPGKKPATPTWVSVTADSIPKLMKDVKEQVDWPGGTNWLSPIAYAMQVDPLPDAIFIMTDGQVINESNLQRKLSQISTVMAKSSKKIPINAIWIENKSPLYKKAMQALASKFGGEFKAIDQNGRIKD